MTVTVSPPRRRIAVGRFALIVTLTATVQAWALMLAAPLAHEVLGLTRVHPGFGPCVALVFLFRMLKVRVTVPTVARPHVGLD